MRPRAFLAAMAVLLITGAAWARPGEIKWRRTTSGGGLATIDVNGNRILLGVSDSSLNLVSFDRDGNLNWQLTREAPENLEYRGCSMATDSQGNIVMCASLEGGTSDANKVLLASYSREGDLNWRQYIPTPGSFDNYCRVLVDSEDNVMIMIGETTAQKWDVLSYSSEGFLNWSKSDENSKPHNLAVDSHDNVIVVGEKANADTTDWRIVSYSSDGELNWEQSCTGGDRYSGAYGVAVGSHDNVLVVGTIHNGDDDDGKIISFSPSGNINWQASYNSGGNDRAWVVSVDPNDNAIVGGVINGGGSYDWEIVSYSPTGQTNWEFSYGGIGNDFVNSLAIDLEGNVVAVGEEYNGQDYDWKIVSISPSGEVNWQASYDSNGDRYHIEGNHQQEEFRKKGEMSYKDSANSVCIDSSTGDIVIAGSILDSQQALLIDCEGPLPGGHTLTPGEVRTVIPTKEYPDPDNGEYLGFGNAALNGTMFKLEAAFPKYLNQANNLPISVKIFIAGVIPSMPTNLLFFDTSNALKFTPNDPLTPWRKDVTQKIEPITLIPKFSLQDDPSLHDALAGTNYWYTLVVPDTVPDDFAGVDWESITWEITVNIFEVTK